MRSRRDAHELVGLGVLVRHLRWLDCGARQGRCPGRRFQSGHRDSDGRNSGLRVVGGLVPKRPAVIDCHSPHLALSRAVGSCDRGLVALLFSSPPARSGFQGCTNRQAEGRVRHPSRRRFSPRTADAAELGRRSAHRRGLARSGVGLAWLPREQHLVDARSSNASDDVHLVRSLLVLTVVTGLIDAVSFLGLGHIFTANMTGNVVLLAFALGGAPGLSAVRSVTALLVFACGGLLGGRVINRRPRGSAALLLVAMKAECVLLLLVAGVTVFAPAELPSASAYAVIVCTAFAMGLRNAIVRKLAV